eukprot:m51a1_g7482 putative phosphatidylinositol 4-kinase (918) ;mRNA; f:211893-215873
MVLDELKFYGVAGPRCLGALNELPRVAELVDGSAAVGPLQVIEHWRSQAHTFVATHHQELKRAASLSLVSPPHFCCFWQKPGGTSTWLTQVGSCPSSCEDDEAQWTLNVVVPPAAPRVDCVAFEVFVSEVALCIEKETGVSVMASVSGSIRACRSLLLCLSSALELGGAVDGDDVLALWRQLRTTGTLSEIQRLGGPPCASLGRLALSSSDCSADSSIESAAASAAILQLSDPSRAATRVWRTSGTLGARSAQFGALCTSLSARPALAVDAARALVDCGAHALAAALAARFPHILVEPSLARAVSECPDRAFTRAWLRAAHSFAPEQLVVSLVPTVSSGPAQSALRDAFGALEGIAEVAAAASVREFGGDEDEDARAPRIASAELNALARSSARDAAVLGRAAMASVLLAAEVERIAAWSSPLRPECAVNATTALRACDLGLERMADACPSYAALLRNATDVSLPRDPSALLPSLVDMRRAALEGSYRDAQDAALRASRAVIASDVRDLRAWAMQVVASLRYDITGNRILSSSLAMRATGDAALAEALLRECSAYSSGRAGTSCTSLTEAISAQVPSAVLERTRAQRQFEEGLVRISSLVGESPATRRADLLTDLVARANADIHARPRGTLRLPTDRSWALTGADPRKAKCLGSGSPTPVLIVLSALCRTGQMAEWGLVLQAGFDAHSEALVLQLIALWQSSLALHGADSELRPYPVVPCCDGGIIGLVEDARTVADLIREHQGDVESYVRALGPEAVEQCARTTAAYAAACYALALRDRHNSNIMVDSHGHVVHIDYAFALGRAPGSGLVRWEGRPFKPVLAGCAPGGGPAFEERFARAMACIRDVCPESVAAVELVKGKRAGRELRKRILAGSKASHSQACLAATAIARNGLGPLNRLRCWVYDSFQLIDNGIPR